MSMQTLIQRAKVSADGISRWARSLPMRSRAAELPLADSAAQAQPTLRARKEELLHFYQDYENLVELLCDAA